MALRDGSAIVETKMIEDAKGIQIIQTPYVQEEIYLALHKKWRKVLNVELGKVDRFNIIIIDDLGPSPSPSSGQRPKKPFIIYGPVRKGRGGKARRW